MDPQAPTQGSNPTPSAPPVTALVRAPQSAISPFYPQSFEDAWRLARTYAAAKMLGELQSPEQVFLIMAYGDHLDVPLVVALQSIHIIKGKAVMSADLMVALCLRRPVCEYFDLVETTDRVATYETKRRGRPAVRMSFTIEDAERAKLLNKGEDSNWRKYAPDMLRHRCSARLARAVFPDLMAGVYCEEEADEIRGTASPAILDAEIQPITSAPPAPMPETDAKRLERLTTLINGASTIEALTGEVHDKLKAEALTGQLRKDVGAAFNARQRALATPPPSDRQPGEEG